MAQCVTHSCGHKENRFKDPLTMAGEAQKGTLLQIGSKGTQQEANHWLHFPSLTHALSKFPFETNQRWLERMTWNRTFHLVASFLWRSESIILKTLKHGGFRFGVPSKQCETASIIHRHPYEPRPKLPVAQKDMGNFVYLPMNHISGSFDLSLDRCTPWWSKRSASASAAQCESASPARQTVRRW